MPNSRCHVYFLSHANTGQPHSSIPKLGGFKLPSSTLGESQRRKGQKESCPVNTPVVLRTISTFTFTAQAPDRLHVTCHEKPKWLGTSLEPVPCEKVKKKHTGTQLKHLLSSINRSVLRICSEVIYLRCSLSAFGAVGDISKVCF